MWPNPAVHRRCAIKPRSAGDLHVRPLVSICLWHNALSSLQLNQFRQQSVSHFSTIESSAFSRPVLSFNHLSACHTSVAFTYFQRWVAQAVMGINFSFAHTHCLVASPTKNHRNNLSAFASLLISLVAHQSNLHQRPNPSINTDWRDKSAPAGYVKR